MLRAATEDDVDTIRRLRNQQANRDVSITSHEITADEHAAWWAKTSADPSRRVLIYERDGRIAGVVNFFDLEGTTGAWGFFLDADGLVDELHLFVYPLTRGAGPRQFSDETGVSTF